MNDRQKRQLSPEETDRVIEMAWEDRTPFDAIRVQFDLPENQVIELMRKELLPASFKRWRKRVAGRATKHSQLRQSAVNRFRCSRQRTISRNTISKRK